MLQTKLVPFVATVVLFGSGVATAALADEPPSTTEPTSTATTTSTETTSPTTTTEPATTTSAEPVPPPAATTTTATPTSTTGSSVPRTQTQTTIPDGASVRDTRSGKQLSVSPPRHRHRHRISKPLEITPPLGRGAYTFPVVGVASYGDSYGAFRGDVRGKWHHGADIFAPLGTPVVAVANGTINRVGWRRLGGWRLWVRDTAANQFYYAHLSGYAPGVFHSRHVRAGDVLGFVGTTGDAFGGEPHLHFEIHPHQLLRLRYDGAVNPTTYLDNWRRARSVEAPVPVHPRLPRRPQFREEARLVFRQLLAARHLIAPRAKSTEPSQRDYSAHRGALSTTGLVSLRREPAAPTVSAANTNRALALLAGLLVVALVVTTPVLTTMRLARVRRRDAEGG